MGKVLDFCWGSWFSAFIASFLFLLLCFSAFCFSCFSAFLLLCFSASPASLLFCFSPFLLSLLLCFSCFSAFLLFYESHLKDQKLVYQKYSHCPHEAINVNHTHINVSNRANVYVLSSKSDWDFFLKANPVTSPPSEETSHWEISEDVGETFVWSLRICRQRNLQLRGVGGIEIEIV